jgi:hypothetical protein
MSPFLCPSVSARKYDPLNAESRDAASAARVSRQ